MLQGMEGNTEKPVFGSLKEKNDKYEKALEMEECQLTSIWY